MAKKNNPPPDSGAEEKPGADEEAARDSGDKLRDYAKYSGLAFQMGLIILIGTLLGRRLDAYFALEKPLLTVLFALLSIAAALYLSLKDLFSSDS